MADTKKKTATKKTSTKKPAVKKAPVKKAATKKVEVKKAEPKKEKVETKKVEVKKSKKENIFKKGKEKVISIWNDNRPFAISCIIILVLVIIIIAVACSKRIPKTKDGSQVLASVDGLKVTADDLYIGLKDQYGTNDVINQIDEYIAKDYYGDLTKDDEKYVDEVVKYYKQYAEYYGVSFEEFLAQYVGINGISDENAFKEYVKNDYKKTLAVQKYIGSTISEEEIKKEFNKNYKEKITVRHILIEVNDDTTEEEAKKAAEDIIKKLNDVKDSKKVEDTFKDLAKDNSDDQATYEDGGLYKNFSKGEVDSNFWAASKKLKNGKYTTEPIKSSYGYHVIYKVSTKTYKYEDVKDEVVTALAKTKLSEDTTLSVKAWDKLRKKYNLKINDTEVKKTYKASIKNGSKAKTADKESTENAETQETSEE